MSNVLSAQRIAMLGAAGYVGSQVCLALERQDRREVVRVLRGDDLKDKLEGVDIIIHAANPAKRFRAESNPEVDFQETVEKTHQIIKCAAGKKLILISSLSCKTQLNINYGRNRRACELLALGNGGIVIRLGPMFGGGRTEDTLHAILRDEEVFVSSETKYAYVDVAWAAKKIVQLIDCPSGIYEIGAKNSISLHEIRDHFHSKSKFTGIDDTQIPNSTDGPDSRLVIEYAQGEINRDQLSRK